MWASPLQLYVRDCWGRVAVSGSCWRWFQTFWIFHSYPQLLQPVPGGKSCDSARRFYPRTHLPFLLRLRASELRPKHCRVLSAALRLWNAKTPRRFEGLRDIWREFRTSAGHSLPLGGGPSQGDSGEGTQKSAPRAEYISRLAWMHLWVPAPQPGRRLQTLSLPQFWQYSLWWAYSDPNIDNIHFNVGIDWLMFNEINTFRCRFVSTSSFVDMDNNVLNTTELHITLE